MLISPQERLGIFIDGADLLAASRALGFCVDFKRLRSLFQQRGKLMRSVFYVALSEDDKGCPRISVSHRATAHAYPESHQATSA
jgi:hypothetical protein